MRGNLLESATMNYAEMFMPHIKDRSVSSLSWFVFGQGNIPPVHHVDEVAHVCRGSLIWRLTLLVSRTSSGRSQAPALRPWLARYKGRRSELQQETGCWDARGDHRKSCPRSIDTPKLGRTMGTGPISGIDWHHCDPFGSFSKQSRSVFESQQALFSLCFWWCGPCQVVFSCATGFGPALLGPPCCFRWFTLVYLFLCDLLKAKKGWSGRVHRKTSLLPYPHMASSLPCRGSVP